MTLNINLYGRQKKASVGGNHYTVSNMLKGPKHCINLEYFEKKDRRERFFFSEITDCKKRSYFNAQKAQCQNTFGQSTC